MLGPRPSSAAAPSIWYAAVLVPNRKPGGSWGDAALMVGSFLPSPGVPVAERGSNGQIGMIRTDQG